MTGCERKISSVPDTETSAIVVVEAAGSGAETETETETETEPGVVMESVDANQVTEEMPDLRETYESSFGYRMKYDKSVFEYNQHGGFDEFVMKTRAFSSDPLVFFAAMRIEAEELDNIAAEVFDESADVRTIGSGDYQALCMRSEEADTKGKYKQYHETSMVMLEDGDALLFEIQWFESADETASPGEKLEQMMQSLEILDAAADLPFAETGEQAESAVETEGEKDE